MSISGAGVLDSDAAHDLYQGVLDRYDAGMPLEQICEWIAAFEAQAVDALELECLLAAGVKVLWEIGHPDDVLLARLLRSSTAARAVHCGSAMAAHPTLPRPGMAY